MRYRLRTLLIILAIGPPLLAAMWWAVKAFPNTGPFLIVFALGLVFPILLRWMRSDFRISA